MRRARVARQRLHDNIGIAPFLGRGEMSLQFGEGQIALDLGVEAVGLGQQSSLVAPGDPLDQRAQLIERVQQRLTAIDLPADLAQFNQLGLGGAAIVPEGRTTHLGQQLVHARPRRS
jgi:hypothetical protein